MRIVAPLILYLLLPVVDLIFTWRSASLGQNVFCSNAVCPELIASVANILLTWILLLALLLCIAHWRAKTGKLIWKIFGSFVLTLAFAVLTVFCLASWGFMVSTGSPPSPDTIYFLIANASRIPAHTLQTSPLISIALVFVITLAAFGLSHAATDLARRLNWWSGRRRWPLVFAALSVALSVSIPYAKLNLSALAVGRSGLAFISYFASAKTPDAALAKDFVASKSYDVGTWSGKPYPVVVLLVESLRRDLVDTKPLPIPFLRSLTDDGAILFDKAYATASHSNYADVAFWYSRYQMRSLRLQGYQENAPYRGLSLFRVLSAHGYRTGYISSQNELWGGMINWLRTEPDHFFHSEDYDSATWKNKYDTTGLEGMIKKGIATAGKIEDSATLKIALEWIDGLKSPDRFMLGMNLQNTHFAYVVPPGGAAPYQPADLDFRTVYYGWPAELKHRIRNRYLNAVLNLDRLIGKFADSLKARGLWDETLFVVVGDSGEAFQEHGFGNHSGPMYDEAMRTFALIKLPKSLTGRGPRGVYEAPISHLDIAATIVDLLGMKIPGSFQGRSILSAAPRGPLFMHTNAIVQQRGIVKWPMKYLYTYLPYRRRELYDLSRDPAEKQNLIGRQPAVGDALGKELDAWLSRHLLYYSSSTYYSNFDPPD